MKTSEREKIELFFFMNPEKEYIKEYIEQLEGENESLINGWCNSMIYLKNCAPAEVSDFVEKSLKEIRKRHKTNEGQKNSVL